MKDCTQRELESSRPNVTVIQAIQHCLDQLYADKRKGIDQEVVDGLTFEELIGALLLANGEQQSRSEDMVAVPDEEAIAETRVRLKRQGKVNTWVVVKCPFCNKQHTHGAGRKGSDGSMDHLGHRWPHCNIDDVPIAIRLLHEKGYVLVDKLTY